MVRWSALFQIGEKMKIKNSKKKGLDCQLCGKHFWSYYERDRHKCSEIEKLKDRKVKR